MLVKLSRVLTKDFQSTGKALMTQVQKVAAKFCLSTSILAIAKVLNTKLGSWRKCVGVDELREVQLT